MSERLSVYYVACCDMENIATDYSECVISLEVMENVAGLDNSAYTWGLFPYNSDIRHAKSCTKS